MKFQRFTYPLLLQQIPAASLARFFDRFKDDLVAKNCRLPAAPPGSEGYCNVWAELLRNPDTLPGSLVQVMSELVEQAAPHNWPSLEETLYESIAAGSGINSSGTRESLVLQLWLWSQDQQAKTATAAASDQAKASAAPAFSSADVQPLPREGTTGANPEPEVFTVAQASPPVSSSVVPPLAPDSNAGRGRPANPQAGTPALQPEPATDGQSSSNGRGMKSIGKIARLPREIREELNRRLENEEEARVILQWLNGVPEVQKLLEAEFSGRPVSKQNLSEWKQYGFRNWQTQQLAVEFAQGVEADRTALPPSLNGALTENLAHWVTLRYAAAAQVLAGMDDDPEAELRRLRSFGRDIVALRRGDLYASRLRIEQARLASEQAATETAKEQEFWSWINRPDIQAKLYPKQDRDQIRRQVVQMLDRELLGIRDTVEEANDPDPAVLI